MAVSRSELSGITGLTEAAISRICRELIEVGLLMEEDDSFGNGKPGRPSVNLQIGRNGAFVLGFDISANSQSVCLVDARGDVLAHRLLAIDFGAPPVRTLRRVAKEAVQLVKTAQINRGRLLGGGVAIAGVVDANNEKLITAPNLGWGGVDVAGVLANELEIPVYVENRPRALLRAEHQAGIAQGKRNIALFQCSLGIGGALILGGNMVRGERNAAGQIGHLPVIKGGELCSCGRRGCLDTVASGHAILAQLSLIPRRRVKTGHRAVDAALLREAVQKANDEDPRVLRAFRSAGRALGSALKGIAVLLDPEIIILGGTVLRARSYIDSVVEKFSKYSDIPILISKIPEGDVASYLALDAFVFSKNLNFAHLGDFV